MQDNINKAIKWLKETGKKEGIEGCITGSIVLGYFPESNQDVDIFLYSENSFTNIFYALYHNPMFQLIDPLDKWKGDNFRRKDNGYYKKGVQTIKFMYNTCVPINIILKKDCINIFSVLSTFDMDIVSIGYDLLTEQVLDLSGDSHKTKIASWNKWNSMFYNPELWEARRLLRQITRCFKYHNRGYNTDNVILKFIEIIDDILILQDIFNSNNYTEKLKVIKNNYSAIKQICLKWLETHEISEEELELIDIKIREV